VTTQAHAVSSSAHHDATKWRLHLFSARKSRKFWRVQTKWRGHGIIQPVIETPADDPLPLGCFLGKAANMSATGARIIRHHTRAVVEICLWRAPHLLNQVIIVSLQIVVWMAGIIFPPQVRAFPSPGFFGGIELEDLSAGHRVGIVCSPCLRIEDERGWDEEGRAEAGCCAARAADISVAGK